jgi:hypothetical protein
VVQLLKCFACAGAKRTPKWGKPASSQWQN